ncbi:unnamed protein product [Adineta ricciae]|uniref:Uncharacterized protein n=1 Tax=Adineta ricciae TaxID=249248 RepID=A0A814A2S4_ADIRI|nr:unnamed protein product [Adineta ricciae]CAF1022864.1 unnamed protein product [Adineta ricciae]
MASADIANNSQTHSAVPTDHPSATTTSASQHEHSHSCCDHSHHHDHDMPSFFDENDIFSSLAGAKKDMAAKRKPKKNQQQGAVRAETIPGHRGDQNIDDLLNFINSPTPASGKKQKKKTAN